eukprot:scaffold27500_cov240-Skeletonema_menzelii.AAC.1
MTSCRRREVLKYCSRYFSCPPMRIQRARRQLLSPPRSISPLLLLTYFLQYRSAEKQTCTYCYCTHADYLYIVDMTKSTILAALFVLLLAPYGARPQGVPECSCSPKAFQFFISSLDLDCEKNDIVNNSGISEATTACFIEGGSPPDPPILGIEEEGKTPEELNPDFKVNNITSIIFKEFDKDDNTISETKQNYR